MTKILDIHQSIIAANGDVSLAKELFTMLLDDLDVRLQLIESSYQANNMETLAEHVHKLYGSTAYCIAPKLRKSAETLEKALQEKNYSQLSKLVDVVLQEIRQLMDGGPTFIKQDWLEFQTVE